MSTSGTVPLHHLYLHPMNHQRMIKFSFESDEQDIQIYVVINIEYDPRVLEIVEVNCLQASSSNPVEFYYSCYFSA
jgi:hypothetical protein